MQICSSLQESIYPCSLQCNSTLNNDHHPGSAPRYGAVKRESRANRELSRNYNSKHGGRQNAIGSKMGPRRCLPQG